MAGFLGRDMFRAVSTDEHPVKDLTVKQLLDAAAAAVPDRFADDRLIAAMVQEALGNAYSALAYDTDAGNRMEDALALLVSAGRSDSRDTLRIVTELVALKYPVGQLPAKIADYQRHYEAAAERYGADDPDVFKLGRALVGGHIQLGHFEAGAAELSAMLAIADASRSDVITTQRLSMQGSLGYVLIELGRHREAEAVLDKLLIDQIASRGKDHRDVGLSKVRLARVHYETGRLDSAERLIDEADQIAAQWDPPHAALPLNVRLYRAWLRYHQRRYAEAVDILLRIKADVAEDDAGAFSQSFTEDRPLGLSYRAIGMHREAEKVLTAGYQSAVQSLGDLHPWTLQLQRDVKATVPESHAVRATASLP